MADKRVAEVLKGARADLARAQSSADLEQVRVKYLGRQGVLTRLLRSLPSLPVSERPEVGRQANQAKTEIESLLGQRLAEVKAAERRRELASQRIDLTLPGRRPPTGTLHPLTLVQDEIIEIFQGLGFAVAEGPEVESDFYNFEALNIPKDHPARDMQDTFYVSDDVLLRTHTSPVQVRVMKVQPPPVRVICPGKVYRRDADITHSPMFHQVEGLAVDTGISMA
ncbi:MAG: phenylalanine--tRNA ligase subunit alpha, partial [Candidatus Rokubacteria bacterium]|nr:phenylalanine--tRNA ligase subunit alpha [Candidatus Rokubacteria bacterium]